LHSLRLRADGEAEQQGANTRAKDTAKRHAPKGKNFHRHSRKDYFSRR
jgi:hypothetical protein